MSNLRLRAISAAAMWGVTAIHTYATTEVMGPTLASAVSTELKGYYLLCWHGVTCLLTATSILYSLPFLGYKQPDKQAIIVSSASWIAMSAAALGVSIQLGQPGLLAFQYAVLSVVPALAIASTCF